MTRQYRKPRRYSTNNSSSRRGGSGGSIKWVIFGIALGVIGMYFVLQPSSHPDGYSGVHMHAAHNAAVPAHTKAAAKQHPVAAADHPAAAGEYDFYTMLPQMQVKALTPAAQQNNARPASAQPAKPVATKPAPTATSTPTVVAATSPAAVAPPPATAPTTVAAAEPASTPPPPAAAATANKTNPSRFIVQVANVTDYHVADRLKAELTMLGLDVTLQTQNHDGQVWNRVLIGPYPSKQQAVERQQQLKQNNIPSIVIKE